MATGGYSPPTGTMPSMPASPPIGTLPLSSSSREMLTPTFSPAEFNASFSKLVQACESKKGPELASIIKVQALYKKRLLKAAVTPVPRNYDIVKIDIDKVNDKPPLKEEDVTNLDRYWHVRGEYLKLSDAGFVREFTALGKEAPKWDIDRTKFHKLPKWKQQKLLTSLAEVPLAIYTFPHADVSPREDLSNIPWSACVGVQRSDTGSEGVLFVELPNKEAVVVKAPAKIAAEMFGTMLCERIGIRCPQMRIAPNASEEWTCIKEALRKCDEQQAEKQGVTKMLGSNAPLLVIEYARAKELADFANNPKQGIVTEAGQEFAKRVFGLPDGQLSDKGRQVLREFGSFVAFDMLINNYDRLPCMWDNSGNPGNVMFSMKDDEVISIDNMVTCIHKEFGPAVDEYMQRVTHTTNVVLNSPTSENCDFRRIRYILMEGCDGHGWPGLGIDIGEEGTIEIQNGFIETVQRIVEGDGRNAGLTVDDLKSDLDTLQTVLGDCVTKTNLRGLDALDFDFFTRVLDIYGGAVKQMKSSPVEWVSDVIPEAPPYLSVRMGDNGRQAGDTYVLTSGKFAGNKYAIGRHPHASSTSSSPESMDNYAQEVIERMHSAVRQRRSREEAVAQCNSKLLELRSAIAQRKLERATSPSDDSPLSRFYSLAELSSDCKETWPQDDTFKPEHRERYLSPEVFQETFGMTVDSFNALPKWRQQVLKKERKLF